MCLRPIPCSWMHNEHYYITPQGVIDKSKIYDNSGAVVANKMSFNVRDEEADFYVSCGKCFECLQKYSNEWALRCALEAKQYVDNCFITLTYERCADTLVKKHLQAFIKRLRERIAPVKIRFFACGEYGSKGRPHFHIIVFGWKPNDLEILSKKAKLFTSKFIEDIWHGGEDISPYKQGFVSVGVDVNEVTAKYCAKYLAKLNKVKDGCIKPFTLMSRRPGIGFDCISIDMIEKGFFINGKKMNLPRYFEKILSKDNDLEVYKAKKAYLATFRQVNRFNFKKVENFLKKRLTMHF